MYNLLLEMDSKLIVNIIIGDHVVHVDGEERWNRWHYTEGRWINGHDINILNTRFTIAMI